MKRKKSIFSSMGLLLALVLLFSFPCFAKSNQKPYTLKVKMEAILPRS
jgi:hypothetical protein